MDWIARRGALGLCGALVLGAGGCVSTDYSSGGSQTASGGAYSVGIAGEWEGTWSSEVMKARDRLRCTVRPPARGSGNWEFHFRFTSEGQEGDYHVICPVRQSGAEYTFSGEGKVAGHGTYRHQGRISGNTFRVTYQSEHDHGTFLLTRAGGAAGRWSYGTPRRNPASPASNSLTRTKRYRR
ncbi:MAG TPA: hypothetical protein VMN36_17630 [Verrucomicrobiales bacterium]|nr:hypothetical protein [Verrucomicrobiales bacterium]